MASGTFAQTGRTRRSDLGDVATGIADVGGGPGRGELMDRDDADSPAAFTDTTRAEQAAAPDPPTPASPGPDAGSGTATTAGAATTGDGASAVHPEHDDADPGAATDSVARRDLRNELFTMEWVRRRIDGDTRSQVLTLLAACVVITLVLLLVRACDGSSTNAGTAIDDGLRETPSSAGRDGLLTFRGNQQRNVSALSKIPDDQPSLRWVFPQSKPLCSQSNISGTEQTECGVGWTGQAALFPYAGHTWAVVGSYARALHFLDLQNGLPLRSITGAADVYKGSPTVDPDGYPLVYAGATDGLLRVVAFDREPSEILWQIDSAAIDPQRPSNDWDASPAVHGDYLIEGGENGYLTVIKLNRSYDGNGMATVAPVVVFNTPTWTEKLIGDVGRDTGFDVESSVAIWDDVVYIVNSAGLIQGWDLSALDEGTTPHKTFEWWIGDDVDATIVIDEEGNLYVAALHKLDSKQGEVMGQLIKLDPTLQMPVVWSAFTARPEGQPQDIIATPAIWRKTIIVSTFQGDIIGYDIETGKERWRVEGDAAQLPSPVVFDGRLLQADCDGNLRAYNLGNGRGTPKLRWTVEVGQCIEATPALWDNWIVVGDRAGYIYGIGTEQ